jgi:hypothetical protein
VREEGGGCSHITGGETAVGREVGEEGRGRDGRATLKERWHGSGSHLRQSETTRGREMGGGCSPTARRGKGGPIRGREDRRRRP